MNFGDIKKVVNYKKGLSIKEVNVYNVPTKDTYYYANIAECILNLCTNITNYPQTTKGTKLQKILTFRTNHFTDMLQLCYSCTEKDCEKI